MLPSLSAQYVGTPGIAQRVEFCASNLLDMLIRKGSGAAATKFNLHGVFQIARNDFYFSPDANFDPDNAFGTPFKDVKLSCRLAAPPSPNKFQFACNDFNACITNLQAIERLIKVGKNDEVMSIIAQHLGLQQFKLSHALFEPKPDNYEDGSGEGNESQVPDGDVASDDVTELGHDFAMASWPVSECCKPHLESLLNTHDICPIPAFNLTGHLIPPLRYESMVKGATVEAHFTMGHINIKRQKRHVFVTIARELQILRHPDPTPASPFKRIKVSMPSPNKGKGRAS
ncbi:hypothetical protein JVU11DRAFT_1098 [Chiua virens]|nr:hypothetical protein JVU11DRAFT_1098 [Chiua virens]